MWLIDIFPHHSDPCARFYSSSPLIFDPTHSHTYIIEFVGWGRVGCEGGRGIVGQVRGGGQFGGINSRAVNKQDASEVLYFHNICRV